MKKVPKRFDNRQNYVVKKISDFPVHESDGTEILLVEVNGKLYQMQPLNTGSSTFSIIYLEELTETGSLNTIYIANKTDVYIWNDVNEEFVLLNVDVEDLINTISGYYQIKNIKLEGITAIEFVESTEFADYGYESSIPIAGVTPADVATVIFNPDVANSGNYAPVNITMQGSIRIFSKISDEVTIRTIEIHKY